jgi:hypothetical protein
MWSRSTRATCPSTVTRPSRRRKANMCLLSRPRLDPRHHLPVRTPSVSLPSPRPSVFARLQAARPRVTGPRPSVFARLQAARPRVTGPRPSASRSHQPRSIRVHLGRGKKSGSKRLRASADRGKSRLATKAYHELTKDELVEVEVPVRGIISWRRRGVLARFSPASNKGEAQTAGWLRHHLRRLPAGSSRPSWRSSVCV